MNYTLLERLLRATAKERTQPKRTSLNMPTVLLISFHFHPTTEIGGRRTTALAKFLVARGVRVVVVSAFGEQDLNPGEEVLPGVIAFPVASPRRILIDFLTSIKHKISRPQGTKVTTTGQERGFTLPARRLAHDIFFRVAYFVDQHKKWSWRAARLAVHVGKRYGAGVVLSSSPPNSVLLAGTLTAKQLRIPHIADLRDPWTDLETSDLSRRLERLLQQPLESWVVNSSAHITSAASTVAESLRRRYPRARDRIHVVRNGYDGDLASSPPETGGRLAILFAGELYLGRDPFPLLEAFENLLKRPEVNHDAVRLTFMGRADSYNGRHIADWISGRRCQRRVILLPPQSREAVAEATAEATVLLNLAQQQPFSVPAKTYEQLICGREILLICENDSETAQIVRGMRGINQVDPRNRGALETCLLDLYHRHVDLGRMLAPAKEEVRRFSRDAANQSFWHTIDSVMTLRDSSSANSTTALNTVGSSPNRNPCKSALDETRRH